MPFPRQKTPDLRLPLLSGGNFRLTEENSPRGTLLVFYRGYHCPVCATYLKELGRLAPDFAARGVGVIAISSDTEERAALMAAKVGAEGLRYAHSLPLAEARSWGLFISTSRGKTSIDIEEPALFSEPGLFLINPDQTLYYQSIQTMPFVRPHFSELLAAIDFAIAKSYPARGEYSGPV